MDTTNKLISIHMLEILNAHSNATHKMGQEELMQRLESEYGERISRHTCSDYLKELRDKGYVLGSRGVYRNDVFTERELRTLIDGVMYGKHIPQKDAIGLIDKLKGLSEFTMKDKGKYMTYVSGINRTPNDSLYSLLDTIDEAIEHNKKIAITQYNPLVHGEKNLWEERVVDPYCVVSDQSRYYLLCHGSREGLEPRRIDRIQSIRILKEQRTPMYDVVGGSFDLGRYMREHVYMFSGKVGRIEIKMDTKRIGDFEDWFGMEYHVVSSDENYTVLSTITNHNAAYYWALQYGASAEVLEPVELRHRIKEGLLEIIKKYE